MNPELVVLASLPRAELGEGEGVVSLLPVRGRDGVVGLEVGDVDEETEERDQEYPNEGFLFVTKVL